MNEQELTLHRTRPAAGPVAQEDLPPSTTSQELLALAHGFGRAAREANRNVQQGTAALDELSKRAQRPGQ